MPQPLTHDVPRATRGCWSDDDGLDAVEACMSDLCTGDRFERLGVIAREHLATGGKRLRARLALATVDALGGERRRAVPWAAATELLHNATLIHDDLQDGDPVRRGHPATWARHGVNQAINAGDLMLMLPIRALAHLDGSDGTRWALAEALAVGAEQVVRGQAAELDLLPRARFEWDAWQAAAEGKTAALFALPVYGGALIAGLSREAAREVSDAIRPLGVLFQIVDDVLDLYGDKGRGAPGADLREGKVSALVVEHLRLHPADRAWLVDLLAAPRESTPDDQVARAIHVFRAGGALEATWARIRALVSRVHDSPVLARTPRLHAAAIDLVGRALTPVLHTEPQVDA